MLKAVAPVLFALATLATPVAATEPDVTDVHSCKKITVALPIGKSFYVSSCS